MVKVNSENFEKKLKIALGLVGSLVSSEAKQRAPVEDGNLRNSIYYEVEDKRVKIGTRGVPYAGFVEYGTGAMVRAHGEHDPENPVTDWEALRKRGGVGQTMPFLRPAVYFKDAEIKRIFKEVFR